MDKLERALEKARKLREAELAASGGARGRGYSDYAAGKVLVPVSNMVEIDESHLERYRILAHRTRSKEADIFRILRTRVLKIMSESNFRTLAITSPNYGDGKTTIALNLAVSIALDLKQTVLLADLDLRKPSVTGLLGIETESGLSDYLVNNRPLAECLLRTSFDRFAILPAGSMLDNSSEVLASPKMAALAEELKSRYDDRIIIYDMPPVLMQDDSLAFLPHIDAVLVIADEGVTKIAEIKRSIQLLSGANVIGTVLNNTGGKKHTRPPGKLEKLFNTWVLVVDTVRDHPKSREMLARAKELIKRYK